MSVICHICLGDGADIAGYHPRCLRTLFRTSKVPQFDIELSKLHTAALTMVGHTSLAGIQKKLSVDLGARRATLRVAAGDGRYVLKPQTESYPNLPENEHVTTRLAQLADIETAPNGLISLKDKSLAYIVHRFDRLQGGRKIRQEDFCQLAVKPIREKYEGSGELCVRLLRRYADEPLVQVLKLYRLLLFTWWSGNGDMHLKNFSLLAGEDGIMRLTPAYDLLNTRLVIPEDKLALPINGKKDNLRRNDWLEFGKYCGLPEKTMSRVIHTFESILHDAKVLIGRSFLPTDQKQTYTQLLMDRTANLH